MAPANCPKLAGACAKPHGELRCPCWANRATICPLRSKVFTKPCACPATSSCFAASCIAYVTNSSPFASTMLKGAYPDFNLGSANALGDGLTGLNDVSYTSTVPARKFVAYRKVLPVVASVAIASPLYTAPSAALGFAELSTAMMPYVPALAGSKPGG